MTPVNNFLVYLIVNRIDGKSYIGKTGKSLDRRWNEHVRSINSSPKTRHGRNYFHRALRKYGVDQFDRCILADGLDVDGVNAMEIYYIALFNSNDPEFGYNCTIGGDGMIPNDVIREKIRRNRLGVVRPQSEAERKWRSEYMRGNTYSLGKTKTDDIKRNMSEAAKNSPKAQAHIRALGKSWLGRKHRPESIEKIRKKHKELQAAIRAAKSSRSEINI